MSQFIVIVLQQKSCNKILVKRRIFLINVFSKTSFLQIAQYFNEVRVTTLDLGPQLPKVLSASLPWQDELGLWVNLEIEYTGLCQATVETQVWISTRF